MRRQPPWELHPHLHGFSDEDLGKVIPISVHADGAELYTNTEYMVWSWSSCFKGFSKGDMLMTKFPFAVVYEQEMLNEKAPRRL